MFFRFIGSDVAVKTVINAAKENGLAKILAEPNLTVISGQDADFLSGGEFPVPVPQNMGVGGASTVTIQFKPFGVMLKFLPVVLDTGRISMKLNIDVSEISADNAVVLPAGNGNFVIPSLTKRSANSSLELDDGQTLGIAGLLSDRYARNHHQVSGPGRHTRNRTALHQPEVSEERDRIGDFRHAASGQAHRARQYPAAH